MTMATGRRAGEGRARSLWGRRGPLNPSVTLTRGKAQTPDFLRPCYQFSNILKRGTAEACSAGSSTAELE